MRRVREFTPFEAIVHTVVKRLGFSLRGIADHLGMCGGAISGAFASGVKTSRTGPTYITRRQIIGTLFKYGATPEEREALCRTYLREHSDYGLLRVICPELERDIADYIVHRMKLLKVFQAAPRKAPPELFSRFGERGHKKRFKPSEQPKEETIIERRHGNG